VHTGVVAGSDLHRAENLLSGQNNDHETNSRRRAVATLGASIAALGVAATSRDASASTAGWKAALEKEDDWMELPGRHRLVFDATSVEGTGHSLFFARNYIGVNKSAYGIEPSQLATIIILRHMATAFGYDDAIWAKYSKTLSKLSSFTDPKTHAEPTRNLFDVKGYGPGLVNYDATVSDLAALGVRFAVCGAATMRVASAIAAETNANTDDVNKELAAHLVPNGRIVPAGIVALNRAQERGYAVSYYTP
jgi:intracellular sulfur oxidation DsrE/DsrF family protein